MERSAVNSYAVAGGTFGLLCGLYAANWLIGTDRPGDLFMLASLFAAPFAAAAYFLASRRFRRTGRSGRLFLAISGWIVLALCIAALVIGIGVIFPRAIAA